MSEKTFSIKPQFTARLTPEETDFVNQHLVELLPENMEEADVTNRLFFLNLVNKTLTKVSAIKDKSNPADLERIQKLKEELDGYKSMQSDNSINADQLQNRIEELERENSRLNDYAESLEGVKAGHIETINQLNEQLSETGEKAETLQKSLTKENRIILDPPPLESAVANEFINRLSERLKQPVTVDDVLWDLFWRYISKQETQIAFPFVMSRGEIKEFMTQVKQQEESPE